MKPMDRFISEREAANGPRWQWLHIGDRVKPKRSRRLGTVDAFIQPLGPNGVPMLVSVRWDGAPTWLRLWATDCLVVREKSERAA
jgi:hypothetical protein